jgi:hypothetical protein
MRAVRGGHRQILDRWSFSEAPSGECAHGWLLSQAPYDEGNKRLNL